MRWNKKSPRVLMGVFCFVLITALLLGGCATGAPPEPTPPSTPAPAPAPALAPAPTPVPTPIIAPTPSPSAVPFSVAVSPEVATNPVKTQHTFTAVVKDAGSSPVENAEVHWILHQSPYTVGAIIEASNATKLDNAFAISRSDAEGKATLTITSTREGDTDLIVFAPDIVDATKHKVFAVKHWRDIFVDWPADAVNKVGTEHTLSIKVSKATTGAPLSKVDIRWTIVDDDPDIFFKGLSQALNSVSTTTDNNGISTVTIKQVVNATGENTIRIEILDKEGMVLFTHDVKKKWIAPTLNISKDGPSTAALAKDVEYAIKVSNDGEEQATSVKVVDEIPEGLTFVSSTPSGTLSGTTVTWNLGDLAANSSKDIAATFTAAKIGTWTNTVKVTCQEGITAEASATLTVTAAPILTITKDGPASATREEKVVYTIRVQNTGNIAATNTVVTDTIPAYLDYVSSSPSASLSGSTATWNLGNLAPAASRVITLTTTALSVGTCTNTAEANADNATKVDASVTTDIKAVAVKITKSGPSTIYLNLTGTFTINVKNTGGTQLTSVVVTDTLPANLTHQSSTPTGTAIGNTVRWSFSSLAVGESKDITLVCKANTTGAFINSVSVMSAEGATDTATASGNVIAEAGMTISITDTLDPVVVGSQTIYETVITNQGLITTHNVKLVVELPTNVSYVSATGPTSHSVVGKTVTFTAVSTVGGGQSKTFRVTVRADSAGDAVCSATMTYDEFGLPVKSEEGTTFYTP